MVRKRVLKIAAVALGLAIMVYGFSAQWFVIPDENMAQESEAADTAESAEPVLTQTMISGRVLSDGLATITIEDSDGNDYIFVRNDAEIQVPERGIEVGAPVTVTYVGVLSAGGLQDVTVVRITVGELSVDERAEKILSRMSLDEKVGQLFLVRCPEGNGAEAAGNYHLAGYILFGRDFAGRSPSQVQTVIQDYQDASKIPMLIAVDEEGGTVNRISINPLLRPTPFQSPQDLFEAGGWDLIASDTAEKTQLLLSLGVNVNLAPVCDVSVDPTDFMYRRAFGQDAALTAQYVKTVVETMNESGIGCVLKHFPGYGSNGDTHTGLVYDSPRLCGV